MPASSVLFEDRSNSVTTHNVNAQLNSANTVGESLAPMHDQMALHLALELTKLGIGQENSGQQHPDPEQLLQGMTDDRTKRSQNMTECVAVPSSEHVAEIVGRQGKFSIVAFKTLA